MTLPSWNRVARWAGYAGFFLFMVLIFVVLTFPTDRVARFVEHKLSNALKAKVSIGDLDINGLSEIELFDVVVDFDVVTAAAPKAQPVDEGQPEGEEQEETERGQQPGGPGLAELPKPDAEDGAPDDGVEEPTTADGAKAAKKKGGKLKIEYLRIGTGLTDLMFGDTTDVIVDAELLGGSIEGAKITYDGSKVKVEVPHFKNVRLENNPLVAKWIPYELSGVLTAKVDFLWDKSFAESKGTIDLTLDETVIRKPSFKTKAYGEFVLTDVNLGTVSTKIVVGKKKDIAVLRAVPGAKDDTVVHVEKFESSGEDVELVFDERSLFLVRPKRPFGDWSLSIQAAFHLTEPFYERVESRDGQEESPNKFLRTIAKADKRFQAAEKNGFFGLNCTGLVKKPDCNLAKPTMRVGIKNVSGGRGEEGSDEPPDGAEEGPGAQENDPNSRQPRNSGRNAGNNRAGAVAGGDEPNRDQPAPAGEMGRPTRGALPTAMDPPAAVVDEAQPNDRVEQIRQEREERMRILREQRAQMMQHGSGGGETPPPAVDYPTEVPTLAPEDGMVPEDGPLPEVMPILEAEGVPTEEAPVDPALGAEGEIEGPVPEEIEEIPQE